MCASPEFLIRLFQVESFEKCHFEERERREILRMAVCSRFLPSVEMTKMAVIQSSQVMNRFYAVLAWLDARLMPRLLSTVLLIKARKKNLL